MSKNNLNKLDLIKLLSKKKGFSINFSKQIIDDLIEILINQIKMGQLNLKNLGSFELIHKEERIGRNPKTMKEFKVSSRKSIRFISSKKITDILNNNNG